MKRVILPLLCLFLLCLTTVAYAGDSVRISIAQFVEHPALDAVLKGFQDDLLENGKSVEFKVYNAHGNIGTVGQIATQIAGDLPDMIVAIATPPAQACARLYDKVPQLKDTPMLFTAITDPLLAGLVKDYAHPGGMITGVSNQMPMGKHLEMVRKFQPQLKTLGVMYNAGEMNSVSSVKRLKAAAAEMGIVIAEAPVTSSADVYQAALSLVGSVDAIYVPTDNTVISALEGVVKVCEKSRLPLYAGDTDSVRRGAVAAMGFDYYEHGRQTGAMARRILAGVKPADTPVEFQKNLSFHMNPAAAARMGLTVSDELLNAADVKY